MALSHSFTNHHHFYESHSSSRRRSYCKVRILHGESRELRDRHDCRSLSGWKEGCWPAFRLFPAIRRRKGLRALVVFPSSSRPSPFVCCRKSFHHSRCTRRALRCKGHLFLETTRLWHSSMELMETMEIRNSATLSFFFSLRFKV